MAYTSINKPSDHFNVVTWTGTSDSTTAVTGVGHQPDFIWIKNRGVADDHMVYDAIRGGTKRIFTNSNGAEGTESQGIQSFDSDGFTTGTHRATGGDSGNNMVSWNWKGANGTASNTDGNITTTVSANTTAGFSILSYTTQIGTSGSNYTLGHGLSSTPEFFIAKSRSVEEWGVYYTANGVNTNYIQLNSTNAQGSNTSAGGLSGNAFVTFSASTINIAYDSWANSGNNGHTMIGYAFHSVKGFSKFGSYKGNGNANGAFVHTGFKPAWVLIRRTDSGDNWPLFDNKRNEFNLTDKRLYPNSSATEGTASSVSLDLLSNGFKLRGTDSQINNSSGTYIYMAFAEHPFVSSTGTPVTAR